MARQGSDPTTKLACVTLPVPNSPPFRSTTKIGRMSMMRGFRMHCNISPVVPEEESVIPYEKFTGTLKVEALPWFPRSEMLFHVSLHKVRRCSYSHSSSSF